jgi:hypothetical protein
VQESGHLRARKEARDRMLPMTTYKRGERAGKVGTGINSIEFARLDKRGADRPVLCSSIVTREPAT